MWEVQQAVRQKYLFFLNCVTIVTELVAELRRMVLMDYLILTYVRWHCDNVPLCVTNVLTAYNVSHVSLQH